MRLMMLSDARNPHTIRWVNALCGRGLDILLFSLQAADEKDYSAVSGLEIETLGVSSAVVRGSHTSLAKVRYLTAIPRIRRLSRRYQPDVTNAHFATSYGLLATLAGLRPRIVSVWGTDVYDAPQQNAALRLALTYVLRSADIVLATSNVLADATRALVQRDIVVTPFGVDTERFAPAGVVPENRTVKRIGIVKALEEKYGIDVLLTAFARIKRSLPDTGVELIIAGDGSQRRRLERLTSDLGLEAHVRFLGRVAYAEVHAIHQSLDLAVYPSVDPSETFGVSAVEAQACGVPVVASAIGGLEEVVAHGKTGLLVPAGQADALADAICSLLTDDGRRRRMGRDAREHVVRKLSLEKSVDIMVEQYERALAHQ